MAVPNNDKHQEYTLYAEHCLKMVAIATDQESRIIQREMAAEWLNLPAVRAIVCFHRGHSLERHALSDQIRPLVFVPLIGFEIAPFQFSGHPDRRNGLDLLKSTFGLDVLADQFFGGLSQCEYTQA